MRSAYSRVPGLWPSPSARSAPALAVLLLSLLALSSGPAPASAQKQGGTAPKAAPKAIPKAAASLPSMAGKPAFDATMGGLLPDGLGNNVVNSFEATGKAFSDGFSGFQADNIGRGAIATGLVDSGSNLRDVAMGTRQDVRGTVTDTRNSARDAVGLPQVDYMAQRLGFTPGVGGLGTTPLGRNWGSGTNIGNIGGGSGLSAMSNLMGNTFSSMLGNQAQFSGRRFARPMIGRSATTGADVPAATDAAAPGKRMLLQQAKPDPATFAATGRQQQGLGDRLPGLTMMDGLLMTPRRDGTPGGSALSPVVGAPAFSLLWPYYSPDGQKSTLNALPAIGTATAGDYAAFTGSVRNSLAAQADEISKSYSDLSKQYTQGSQDAALASACATYALGQLFSRFGEPLQTYSPSTAATMALYGDWYNSQYQSLPEQARAYFDKVCCDLVIRTKQEAAKADVKKPAVPTDAPIKVAAVDDKKPADKAVVDVKKPVDDKKPEVTKADKAIDDKAKPEAPTDKKDDAKAADDKAKPVVDDKKPIEADNKKDGKPTDAVKQNGPDLSSILAGRGPRRSLQQAAATEGAAAAEGAAAGTAPFAPEDARTAASAKPEASKDEKKEVGAAVDDKQEVKEGGKQEAQPADKAEDKKVEDKTPAATEAPKKTPAPASGNKTQQQQVKKDKKPQQQDKQQQDKQQQVPKKEDKVVMAASDDKKGDANKDDSKNECKSLNPADYLRLVYGDSEFAKQVEALYQTYGQGQGQGNRPRPQGLFNQQNGTKPEDKKNSTSSSSDNRVLPTRTERNKRAGEVAGAVTGALPNVGDRLPANAGTNVPRAGERLTAAGDAAAALPGKVVEAMSSAGQPVRDRVASAGQRVSDALPGVVGDVVSGAPGAVRERVGQRVGGGAAVGPIAP